MAEYYLIDGVSPDGAIWVEDVVFSVALGILYAKVGMKFQVALSGVATLDLAAKDNASFNRAINANTTINQYADASVNLPRKVVSTASMTTAVTHRADFKVSQDA
jgi:hypothetical protein